jgi:NADH-quinone oxidoreductase subunit L
MGSLFDSFAPLSWPTPERMLPWIVLFPLLGAIINGFFGRRASNTAVNVVSVGSVTASFALALYCFVRLLDAGAGGEDAGNHSIVADLWHWFSVSVEGRDVPIRVRFVLDHLSGIMTLMVTGIAALIHVYSTEYMGEDPSYPRFMTYLNLFTASMLILVLGSSLPVMFVGWEGVGLCSYLLIGFWWENPTYAAAGRKAFVVNRIGDFGVLIGTFLLFVHCHTFEMAEINSSIVEFGAATVVLGGAPIGITVATAAALFLFLGCTGKSAQLPLYVWLPDAMAGPTPVSALIHAATMVTAGVYLCCRLSPVFMMSETAMATIAVVGALTALLGASIGLVQTQMKKILAYSTVSQLGFMFAAVGCGAFAAGFFHVFTHAFFKACLFLGAGSVMHAVHAHGDADIRQLGGMKRFMPVTQKTFLVACLAIAGVPFFSGFFSKDEILAGALEATGHLGWVGWFVFVVLGVTAFLTACYMFRLYFLTFEGEYRGGPHLHPREPAEHRGDHTEHGGDHEPHESGAAVTIVLGVLAVGAVIAGYLGLPHWAGPNWWAHWLTGEGEHFGAVARWAGDAHAEGHEGPPVWLPAVVGTVAALGGIALARFWYDGKTDVAKEKETLLLRGVIGIGAAATLGLIAYPLAMRIGTFLDAPAAPALPIVAMVIGLALLIGVAGMALFIALNPRTDVHRWAFDKWRVDELYDAILLRPFRWLAVVSANIDRIAVDGLLTWVPAQGAKLGGWALGRAQNGLIYAYTLAFTVGTGLLLWWFTYPHTDLSGEIQGHSIEWRADPGPAYEYRWDFDSDGEYDTDWSAESTARHQYGAEDAYFGLVATLDVMGGQGDPEPIELELERDRVALPLDELGTEWIQPREDGAGGDPRLPTVHLDGGEVVVIPHDAHVSGPHADEEGNFRLAPGDTVRIGPVTMHIDVRVRATVQVRNAFGNVTRGREDMTLRVPHMALEPIALVTRRSTSIERGSSAEVTR